jgi:hypothetical protein
MLDLVDPEDQLANKRKDAFKLVHKKGTDLCRSISTMYLFGDDLKAGTDQLPQELKPPSSYDFENDALGVAQKKPGECDPLARDYQEVIQYRLWQLRDNYENIQTMPKLTADKFKANQAQFLKDMDGLLENRVSATHDLVERLYDRKLKIFVVAKCELPQALAKLVLFQLDKFVSFARVISSTTMSELLGLVGLSGSESLF